MIQASELYAWECAALAIVACAISLIALHRLLARGAPGFDCRLACAVAFAVRVVVVLAVAALGDTGQDLRGPDDPAFLDEGMRLADRPFSIDWVTDSRGDLLS